MMVRRDTFEKFKEEYPDYSYKPDHNRTVAFDGSREIHMFFQALIDPESKRYLSEDYMFCQWCRNVGISIFLCPWMKLKHAGTHIFGGSLEALAGLSHKQREAEFQPPVARNMTEVVSRGSKKKKRKRGGK